MAMLMFVVIFPSLCGCHLHTCLSFIVRRIPTMRLCGRGGCYFIANLSCGAFTCSDGSDCRRVMDTHIFYHDNHKLVQNLHKHSKSSMFLTMGTLTSRLVKDSFISTHKTGNDEESNATAPFVRKPFDGDSRLLHCDFTLSHTYSWI